MSGDLGPEKALIFRITHLANVPWILVRGLHCRSSAVRDPNFVPIGDQEIIDSRRGRPVRCHIGGTLSDYIPFYFTSHSPMFYNIRTGHRGLRQFPNEEIVIMVSSLPTIKNHGIPFVFTDRHALLATAQVFTDLRDLDKIDWDALRRGDFSHDPEDPRKMERYQAEALVHRHVPIDALHAIVCFNKATRITIAQQAAAANVEVTVAVKPGRYFT